MPAILLAFNAALALAEKLLPLLSEAFARGEMSVADQQAARDRYLALRTKADGAFTGDHWQPSAPNDGQV